MRALVLESPGPEPHFAIHDIAEPVIGPKDVLVQVSACGICYHDIAVMQGLLRRGVSPNIILGHEIAGVIVQRGSQVTTVQIGDHIATLLTDSCGSCDRCLQGLEHRCLYGKGIGHSIPGGFAERVRVSENSVVVLPQNLDLETSCVLGCPMGVALEGLRDRAALQPGETCLVTGVGGGLGTHTLQIAKAMGARTLAVTSSPEKVERLEELNADELLIAGELDFGELALALTEDKGVDVVVNTVGSEMFDSCLRALAPYGRMLILGEISGGTITLNPAELVFKEARLIGSAGTNKQNLSGVIELVNQGAIRPIVSEIYRFEDIQIAYQSMLQRESFGRIALRPD